MLIILLTGCINIINVDQKLKRNGHYDIGLTISTAAEYKMILNGIKESFQVDDSVKDKFTYSETDTSVTYSFKDINPATDKKLFKETQIPNGTDNTINLSSGSSDSSIINPENIEVKKELKFPYYEYTYTLKMTAAAKNSSNETTILTEDNYIFDDANILDSESKKQIMQSINNIYKNDSVEVIIITKKQMSETEYNFYVDEFASNHSLDNKQYILIFASFNETGVCSITSNIYTEPNVSSKVDLLNTDFEKSCRTNYSAEIKDTITQLDNFFKVTDLESTKQLTDQLGQLFKIGYTVEVFGKIIDTNGQQMDGNKVKFDINPEENGQYTIVFQDFFLASILGDMYLIYLIGVGVILIIIIGIVIISKHNANVQSTPPEVPSAVNPQLREYIRRARINRMTDPQIKDVLTKNGWSPKDIDTALKYT